MNEGVDVIGAYDWQQQLRSGDFSGTRLYLAHSQKACDWQDRCFFLNLIAPDIPMEPLKAAYAAEPEAADLQLLQGLYSYGQLHQSRGTQTAEKTNEQQFREAGHHLQNMMMFLRSVYSLTPEDPTPHVFALRGLMIFSDNKGSLKQEYAEAVRLAPACVPAHYSMVNARSQKWGGSHEEALQLAHAAQAAGGTSSDLPACLFLAHFHVWQYIRVFDKNKLVAEQYLKNKRVIMELNQALDHWVGDDYRPRRSSLPYLHQAAVWYYLTGDNVRLGRLLALIGDTPNDQVWGQIGNAQMIYAKALQNAVFPSPAKTGILGWFQRKH